MTHPKMEVYKIPEQPHRSHREEQLWRVTQRLLNKSEREISFYGVDITKTIECCLRCTYHILVKWKNLPCFIFKWDTHKTGDSEPHPRNHMHTFSTSFAIK